MPPSLTTGPHIAQTDLPCLPHGVRLLRKTVFLPPRRCPLAPAPARLGLAAPLPTLTPAGPSPPALPRTWGCPGPYFQPILIPSADPLGRGCVPGIGHIGTASTILRPSPGHPVSTNALHVLGHRPSPATQGQHLPPPAASLVSEQPPTFNGFVGTRPKAHTRGWYVISSRALPLSGWDSAGAPLGQSREGGATHRCPLTHN